MAKLIRAICLILILNKAYAAPTLNHHALVMAIQQYLSAEGKAEGVSAMSVSVASSNKPIVSAFVEGQRGPYSSVHHPLFQIGSITKSFIAAIILQLEADPRYHFNINQRLGHFFPQYPDWQNIKIKNLLDMTSGIPDIFSNDQLLKIYLQHPLQQQNISEWLNLIYARHLLFTPGTQYSYSNTNYFLLGRIIEQVTGHSLNKEIQTRLIKPLHLNHTYYANVAGKKLVPGYQFENGFADYIPRGENVTKYNLSYVGPAGAIISTSKDIVKWVEALFTPDKVLPKKQFREMLSFVSEKNGQPVQFLKLKNPEAFGLGIRCVFYGLSKNNVAYAYEGMTLGYRALYVYSPSDHILIATTVNSSFDGKTNHLYNFVNHLFRLTKS